MNHCDVGKSIVQLTWYDRRTETGPVGDYQLANTGFVMSRNDAEPQGKLGILTTCHQLKGRFPLEDAACQTIGVRVVFFDGVTALEGQVIFGEPDLDLCFLVVNVDNLKTHNVLNCVHPVTITKDKPHENQIIYTIHHPILRNPTTNEPTQMYFQRCTGHITDGSDPSIIHFRLSLTMPGSSGAPIFDFHSNYVVSMVKSGEYGVKVQGTNSYLERQYGISIPTIEHFFSIGKDKYGV